jgi:hypothetical protein
MIPMFNPNNQFCIKFLNDVTSGTPATEADKQKFRSSLKTCHDNGYYIMHSKRQQRWILSNMVLHTLELQRESLDHLVDGLFQSTSV